MGRGFRHGVSLYDLRNFSVAAYPSEAELLAAAAEENAIGIVTKRAVTDWVFSGEAPGETGTGKVWIETGKTSPYGFNGLKEGVLQISPLLVRQYAAGEWSYVPAFSVKDGEWVFWWSGQLYWGGDEIQRVTGGWQAVADAGSTGLNAVAPTVNKYSTYMKCQLSGYKRRGYVSTVNAVELDRFQELEVKISTISKSGSESRVAVEIVDEEGNTLASMEPASAGANKMDIRELTGMGRVRITLVAAERGSATLGVTSILMV